jgi:hypothetical protein
LPAGPMATVVLTTALAMAQLKLTPDLKTPAPK